jgi:hypothetical protein
MSGVPAFSCSNSRIQNGSVFSSDIDMDTGVITNHGTPVAGTDVVNKDYCDGNTTSSIPVITITLLAQTWNNILPTVLDGEVSISIKNVVLFGPCARFTLCKNEQSRQASIVRWSSTAGITTEERLEVRWQPNTGIEVRKNGNGYDGDYNVKYILNE